MRVFGFSRFHRLSIGVSLVFSGVSCVVYIYTDFLPVPAALPSSSVRRRNTAQRVWVCICVSVVVVCCAEVKERTSKTERSSSSSSRTKRRDAASWNVKVSARARFSRFLGGCRFVDREDIRKGVVFFFGRGERNMCGESFWKASVCRVECVKISVYIVCDLASAPRKKVLNYVMHWA